MVYLTLTGVLVTSHTSHAHIFRHQVERKVKQATSEENEPMLGLKMSDTNSYCIDYLSLEHTEVHIPHVKSRSFLAEAPLRFSEKFYDWVLQFLQSLANTSTPSHFPLSLALTAYDFLSTEFCIILARWRRTASSFLLILSEYFIYYLYRPAYYPFVSVLHPCQYFNCYEVDIVSCI